MPEKIRWALVFVIATGSAIGLLWYWRNSVVDPWAARASRGRELRSYDVPGQFGDSFAPAIGVLTARALGATAASTYMQQLELREARRQNKAQAEATVRSFAIDAHANRLAAHVAIVETMRQIAEIDATAIAEFAATQTYARSGDHAEHWDKYVEGDRRVRGVHYNDVHSGKLVNLAERRRVLERMLERIHADIKKIDLLLEPTGTVAQAET